MARLQQDRTQTTIQKSLIQKAMNSANGLNDLSPELEELSMKTKDNYERDMIKYLHELENKVDFLSKLIAKDYAERHPDIVLKYPEYFMKD